MQPHTAPWLVGGTSPGGHRAPAKTYAGIRRSHRGRPARRLGPQRLAVPAARPLPGGPDARAEGAARCDRAGPGPCSRDVHQRLAGPNSAAIRAQPPGSCAARNHLVSRCRRTRREVGRLTSRHRQRPPLPPRPLSIKTSSHRSARSPPGSVRSLPTDLPRSRHRVTGEVPGIAEGSSPPTCTGAGAFCAGRYCPPRGRRDARAAAVVAAPTGRHVSRERSCKAVAARSGQCSQGGLVAPMLEPGVEFGGWNRSAEQVALGGVAIQRL